MEEFALSHIVVRFYGFSEIGRLHGCLEGTDNLSEENVFARHGVGSGKIIEIPMYDCSAVTALPSFAVTAALSV